MQKDGEGIVSHTYDTFIKGIVANVYPASGRVQSQMYGDRLAYMFNMITDIKNEIDEKNALCIDDPNAPDYKVVSKRKVTNQIAYELEKL